MRCGVHFVCLTYSYVCFWCPDTGKQNKYVCVRKTIMREVILYGSEDHNRTQLPPPHFLDPSDPFLALHSCTPICCQYHHPSNLRLGLNPWLVNWHSGSCQIFSCFPYVFSFLGCLLLSLSCWC